jgi:hypothetical protein
VWHCWAALSLLGHIAEEQRDPIAMDIYTTVDRNTDCRPRAARIGPVPGTPSDLP